MNGHVRETGAIIKLDGYHPEAGFAWEYTGGGHHFWFYSQIEPAYSGDKSMRKVKVLDATTKRFDGIAPKFRESELAVIVGSIRKFFLDGSYLEIDFEWRIR